MSDTREVLFMMKVRELKGAAFNVGQLAALLPLEGDGVPLTAERRAVFISAINSVLDLFYPESYGVQATPPEQPLPAPPGREPGQP